MKNLNISLIKNINNKIVKRTFTKKIDSNNPNVLDPCLTNLLKYNLFSKV